MALGNNSSSIRGAWSRAVTTPRAAPVQTSIMGPPFFNNIFLLCGNKFDQICGVTFVNSYCPMFYSLFKDPVEISPRNVPRTDTEKTTDSILNKISSTSNVCRP